jgi:hypothetical protein
MAHLKMSVMCKRTWSILGGGLLWAIVLSACGTLPAPSGDKKSDSAAVDSSGTLATTSMDKNCDPAAVVSTVRRSLQRQVREREQRIAELESQLETLKAIDRDAEKRSTFSRSPATLTPAATDQRR